MAKYSEDHKRATREAILKHAAERFRREGIAAVGVRPLMADAGLTHGGFYSHFGSRADLVAETLEYASASTHAYFEKAVADCPDDKKLETIVRRYLRPIHRDHMGLGCSISALSPEIARESEATRLRLTPRNLGLVRLITENLPAGGDADERSERASVVFGAMLGTLQLMRIETDPEIAARLAKAGCEAALRIASAPWRSPAA